MTIKIGDWEFDHFFHDEEADVFYLSIGEPRSGYGEETPEGHVLRYDEDGKFCGLTLIGAERILKEEDEVAVTIPRREHVRSEDLALAGA